MLCWRYLFCDFFFVSFVVLQSLHSPFVGVSSPSFLLLLLLLWFSQALLCVSLHFSLCFLWVSGVLLGFFSFLLLLWSVWDNHNTVIGGKGLLVLLLLQPAFPCGTISLFPFFLFW